jgi:hypothetical protein
MTLHVPARSSNQKSWRAQPPKQGENRIIFSQTAVFFSHIKSVTVHLERNHKEMVLADVIAHHAHRMETRIK